MKMRMRSIFKNVDTTSGNRINLFLLEAKKLFCSPITTRQQMGVIVFLAILSIFFPQATPIDWDLNTQNFWSAGLSTYSDPSVVYPPWALILMVPYYLMRAEGARALSVLVIGWLCYQRRWSLSKFLAIVISPFFLVTMAKSNMDILVIVFPILLWEVVQGTRWQTAGRGLALSLLLLKPQGAILIFIYLLWNSKNDWRGLVKPMLMVALITIPISLIGSPPLILQWIDNLVHPDPQNAYYWSVNNLSFTNYFTPISGVMVVLASFATLYGVMRWRGKSWHRDHTLASLLLISMFLSPYTSQQSFSSGLAFIPSWASFFIQNFVLVTSMKFLDYFAFLPLILLLIGLASLYFFQPLEKSA